LGFKGIVRAVVQRVAKAQVTVGPDIVGEIRSGLCIFLGVGKDDGESNADFLSEKIKNLRIFEDHSGKMNLSLVTARGEILIISQFTLYGDWRKGNRPSFTEAASPAQAEKLYEHFVKRFRDAGISVATGQFGARMKVSLVNDGPVTFVLES
jgi:D-tyrosyl-tRNA(Tyr) deacylase